VVDAVTKADGSDLDGMYLLDEDVVGRDDGADDDVARHLGGQVQLDRVGQDGHGAGRDAGQADDRRRYVRLLQRHVRVALGRELFAQQLQRRVDLGFRT